MQHGGLGSQGLDSEVGFWHALLDPANANNSEVDPEAWKSAQDWVQSGALAQKVIRDTFWYSGLTKKKRSCYFMLMSVLM